MSFTINELESDSPSGPWDSGLLGGNAHRIGERSIVARL